MAAKFYAEVALTQGDLDRLAQHANLHPDDWGDPDDSQAVTFTRREGKVNSVDIRIGDSHVVFHAVA